MVRSVCFHDNLFPWVEVEQDWGCSECFFEVIKGFLTLGGPLEGLILLGKLSWGASESGEPLNEAPIDIHRVAKVLSTAELGV